MAEGLRVLVASPLGEVVAAPLRSHFPDWTVEVAAHDAELVRKIAGRVRFDVVTADLVWNRPETEWVFDGLDVIESLRLHDRLAPVLLTAQGHSMEVDLIEEARQRDDVVGVVAKADGFGAFADAVRIAALGRKLPQTPAPGRTPSLYELFDGRRGNTAGRMAGAIAAGHASDTATLAAVAKVSPNTANKITSHYIGPIIIQRGEHDERLPMTQASVYRWCGLHARYLMSWCRRNGHRDVLTP